MTSAPLKVGQLALFAMLAMHPTSARSQQVTVTLDGVYRYTGAAPSPTPNFRLSFSVNRSPLACGGSLGGVLVCGVTAVQYTNGPLNMTLATSAPPSVLFYDASQGGGFALYQSDLGLNRLHFTIGSSVLFSGSLGSPTLVDGVYAVAPNLAPCSPIFGCSYDSFAGQSFASGDPVNNPFFDPVTLQSYDPLDAGTITIASATTTAPEPASSMLILTGLAGLAAVSAIRGRKTA